MTGHAAREQKRLDGCPRWSSGFTAGLGIAGEGRPVDGRAVGATGHLAGELPRWSRGGGVLLRRPGSRAEWGLAAANSLASRQRRAAAPADYWRHRVIGGRPLAAPSSASHRSRIDITTALRIRRPVAATVVRCRRDLCRCRSVVYPFLALPVALFQHANARCPRSIRRWRGCFRLRCTPSLAASGRRPTAACNRPDAPDVLRERLAARHRTRRLRPARATDASRDAAQPLGRHDGEALTHDITRSDIAVARERGPSD